MVDSFRNYLLLEKGKIGKNAGKLELVSTPLKTAISYAEKLFKGFGRELYTEIPEFEKNYLFAQKRASKGHTKRRDMPVISSADIKDFQHKLKRGYIDLRKPFANYEDEVNPFPKGLSGAKAKEWLQNGLEIHDGSKRDDMIKVHPEVVTLAELHPIQEQIYFDKAIEYVAEFGAKSNKTFITQKTTFVISDNKRIIDGHHRYLSGVLVNPKSRIKTIMIELPIRELLPLSLSYSDSIGNKRNA